MRSTREARNFYYEVLARGKVVFSDVTQTPDITLALTPQMTPEVRLLVYQLLPNAEVAADWLPFKVAGDYPQHIEVRFDRDEARPGDELELVVQTEGAARIGLAAVDRSVFILAENRLNLQQVFDELERLYLQPQVELHPDPFVIDPFSPIVTPGAKETFQEAGVVVLSNRQVPEGKRYEPQMMVMEAAGARPMAGSPATDLAGTDTAASSGQAEVQRVRQFFPETWIWSDSTSDASGRASQRVTAPDSITTWMVRAVALSKETGLGIAETELRVFQPFFVSVDLPYSAIRGEEFPARVALYNYTPATEEWTVELEAAAWFDLLDTPSKQVTVAANSVGAVEFMIRPTGLGVNPLKVTARSASAADAIIKHLIVEPEGVQREVVENLVLTAAGAVRTVRLDVPQDAIAGSARAYLSLTGNVLSQTIDGLESLLQMPFGCGEQNMILFAPNVFVTRYLQETNQIKPEIMAKAEKLMLTGYQRELTYRRDDASFSAFGQSDDEGSLWLTAFVLKTFAQARDLIYIDETVLDTAQAWITGHQQADGSFEPVGFLHHQELLGGLQGKTALTAYVAVALREAGDDAGAGKAIGYLEARLDETVDAYALALMTYALALAQSPRAQDAQRTLMKIAHESDEGLSWGDEAVGPLPVADAPISEDGLPPQSSAAIETTGYATLALLALGDNLNAGRATRWLASRRNAFGGFGSTQDTIVALQAMTTAAGAGRADLDATITLSSGTWRKEVRVTPENADVLQILEAPAGESLAIDTQGKGQITAQSVLRFNVPEAVRPEQPIFSITVQYDVDQVEVNDLIAVTATVRFTPPSPQPTPTEGPPIRAGMVVLDIAIPTGFEPVSESVDALIKGNPKLKRWDLAGRKVILYLEDMVPDEQLVFVFQARALYPVKAQPVASQAYSYYRPEWKGESLGRQIVVSA